MPRLTQGERRLQTREALVRTARRVFLEHGFHGASLDEIAERAGYSKGAVYSNFAGKDDLFLAVLDDHFERRARAYTDIALDAPGLDAGYRAVARFRVEADLGEPAWEPVLLEFWTHASRREGLRRAVSERRERFLDVVANIIDELGRRHGVGFAVPVRDAARGSAALLRGLAAERALNSEAAPPELAEELHTAYMTGLTRPRPEAGS